MMTIYLSRSFPRSNSSFFLCSGNALKSEVLRLREDIFLMDAGLGTPRICIQDEPTGVPINRTTRFENKVGSTDVVASESLIKKHILERFFIDLVAGESLIKERAAARFKKLVGSTDVVAGEPLLLLPRRFRKNRAWMKLNQIWRKLKNPWFPGITLFRPSCFGTGKKKRFFAQLAHSAGPTCILYLAEETSDRLEFLPSWDSMDQDLLLLYGQYRSTFTLVDHMDVEKTYHFDELETSLFNFYLPSSYLCFVCSREELNLIKPNP